MYETVNGCGPIMRNGEIVKADKEKIKDLTLNELMEWQDKLSEAKNMKEYKAIGREFRDKYSLTDAEALNLLRNC